MPLPPVLLNVGHSTGRFPTSLDCCTDHFPHIALLHMPCTECTLHSAAFSST